MTDEAVARFCWSCGAEATGGRFCSGCGANLAEPSSVSPGQAPSNSSDSSAAASPQAADKALPHHAAHTPEKPSGRRLSPWLLLVGVGLVGVIAVVVVVGTRAGSSPTVHGTLVLIGGGGYTTDTPCEGTSNGLVDFSDMRSSTPIKILDASGTIIGSGLLGPGTYEATGGGVTGSGSQCKFTFLIPLDAASTHYQVVIGSRPPYDFTDPNALDLSIGGPPR